MLRQIHFLVPIAEVFYYDNYVTVNYPVKNSTVDCGYLFYFSWVSRCFLNNQLYCHFLYCFGFNLKKKSWRKSNYLQSTVEFLTEYVKSRGPILRITWPETCSNCGVLTNQRRVFKFCLSHVAHFFLWNYDFNWRLHNWLCRKPRLFGWNLYLYFFDRSTSVNKQNYLYRGPCSSWFWKIRVPCYFFFKPYFVNSWGMN